MSEMASEGTRPTSKKSKSVQGRYSSATAMSLVNRFKIRPGTKRWINSSVVLERRQTERIKIEECDRTANQPSKHPDEHNRDRTFCTQHNYLL